MYFKIKNKVFVAFYVLLVLRFLFLIWDPRVYDGELSTGSIVYTGMVGLVDVVYVLTNLILIPVNWAFNFLFMLVPALHTDWFPSLKAAQAAVWMKEAALNSSDMVLLGPFRQAILTMNPVKDWPGVFDWLALISIGVLRLLSPLMDNAYEFCRNMLWNIFIEVSFTQKKQAMYQEALQKRAKDLMKLNVEYRKLSREASKLKDSVVTDALTQVFNKRYFTQKMDEAFDVAKIERSRLALIMMDIDHFKRLNDKYGHLVGDEVLHDVATLIKNAMPDNVAVCRFGGEEFSVILPEYTLGEVQDLAEKVKDGMPNLRFDVDADLRVSLSQGIVYLDFSKPFANALEKADDFIKFADDELYRAKLEGRSRICLNHLG